MLLRKSEDPPRSGGLELRHEVRVTLPPDVSAFRACDQVILNGELIEHETKNLSVLLDVHVSGAAFVAIPLKLKRFRDLVLIHAAHDSTIAERGAEFRRGVSEEITYDEERKAPSRPRPQFLEPLNHGIPDCNQN